MSAADERARITAADDQVDAAFRDLDQATASFAAAARDAIWGPCDCPACTLGRVIAWPFRFIANQTGRHS